VTLAALLVHSGGFTSRQWRKLGEQLAPTHRVMAPDLIGYGADRYPVGKPFHFDQDVDRLIAMLAEPTDLVGHSYGGLLALQIAIRAPHLVRRIAVYEPVAFGVLAEPADHAAIEQLEMIQPYAPDEHGVDDRWLAAFVDWWNGPGAWTQLAEPTRQAFRDVGWKLACEVTSLMADRTGQTYAKVVAPTLLLGGGLSPMAEQRTLERLATTLPHARLERFAQLGHMGPITHAREVNLAITGFLLEG